MTQSSTHIPLLAEAMVVWRPFWNQSLRHLSDHDLYSEAEYVDRELVELLHYDAIVDGHVDLDDYTAGILVRQLMLEEEIARRLKFRAYANYERPDLVTFAQRIKIDLDLPAYIVHLGYCHDMRSAAGRYYMARCPLHSEHTASFFVWMEPTPHWHCFGCGDSGDVYDFVMKVSHAEWYDAVKTVADYLSIAMPKSR